MLTSPISLDRYTLAWMSAIGSSLDALGALYLAYDLLGGEHGPLRTLTRAVTYGALFGIAYGLVLGPVFGLASGAAHGITLAWEYSRASRRESKPGFLADTAMSAIRGCGFGVGAAYSYGAVFGAAFGILSTAGQVIAYRLGVRPTVDYRPAKRLRITRFQLLAALNRTAGYGVAGYVSSLVANGRVHAITVGLKTGIGIGLVTAIVGSCTPFVEWTADHVPERGMGVLGVALILIGFTLQSVQYWAVLLKVGIR